MTEDVMQPNSNIVTIAAAIGSFLMAKARRDLAISYHAGMEVQVLVARDGGTRVGSYDGHRKLSYSDGAQTWYPIRVPRNSWGDPEDNSSKPMTWDISEHAEGIGMTGWCFSERRSLWSAYDFDAIVGHSTKHLKKMTDEELGRVRAAACAIPWVEVRKSTSGSGIHLYVRYADPPITANHDEHAALSRATLGEMSAITGFDFESRVDVCGGNMWVWARKMEGTDGLTVVKAAERPYQGEPRQWRQHLTVVRGQRKKCLPEFLETGTDVEEFDQMAGTHPRVVLDQEHKKQIEWLKENGGYGWWDPDRRMLVGHTEAFKRMHQALNLRGPFETISDGTEPDSQNAYAFPCPNGAWVLRRYTKGVAEAVTWDQDGQGYTRCWFNREADLAGASRTQGGVETSEGGYSFRQAKSVHDVVKLLGGLVGGERGFKIPDGADSRQAQLLPHKDGRRVIVEIKRGEGDVPRDFTGWYAKRGNWYTVVPVRNQLSHHLDVGLHDDIIRHAVCSNADSGWFIKVEDHWNCEPLANVGLVLASLGKKKPEAQALLGAAIRKPWTLVCKPFQEEYPGDREWNQNRAKYRFPRAAEIGPFPHWQKVFDHCGEGLNDALAINPWAMANDVRYGADYLKLIFASILQQPHKPTPYIGLWGEQNCGKTILHECIKKLIDGGHVLVNSIFEKDEKFNNQLENAVFCAIEEMDLQKDKKAYEKIKIWVTSDTLTIRKPYLGAYQVPNYTHFFHTVNKHEFLPAFPGDTRVTVIYVEQFKPGEMIPREQMDELLQKEAPHFLNHLLSLEIPPSNDRLAIPVIETSYKRAMMEAQKSPLETFIEQNCHYIPGEIIYLTDFYDRFQEKLDADVRGKWPRTEIKKKLPPERYPVGKGPPSHRMHTCVGNISFTAPDVTRPAKRKLQLIGGQLD